ncbi:MAG TPA: carboxypeptidase-like regulatory domain-containing protein, partial [Caldithrix sp.]|nr:carboxypeptidase-like regulatory domain-containing protein [Caldithrix sp.]
MKFVKTVAILVAMLTLANAQNGKIIGLVTDQQTGDALVETNILLENLNVGTATDENGEFVFENVPYGKYLISASYIGYRVFKKEIRVQSSETVKIDIKMVPIIIPGQEVVIVSTRAKVRETPVVFSNISEE